jgi:cyclohexadieny/prephenate dehydrogenase
MPRQVTIIGLGLIGSSLARALKAHPTSYEVSGADKSPKVVETIRKLGIMKTVSTDIARASATADIVVLATPLSAYPSVMERISPSLKEQAIITDVGSVKGAAIESILPFMTNEQRRYFVPGHPIAGTENSGPEAGFAELFQSKRLIITPLSFSEREAITEVMDMWEEVGANVEVMETKKHDEVYALVSHMVQLLCSAFMLSIVALPKETFNEIRKKKDENFMVFLRLAGSDPVMWRDIFTVNSPHIEAVVRRFSMYFLSMVRMVEGTDSGGLGKRLSSARKKREQFFEKLRHQQPSELTASDFSAVGAYARAYLDALPVLIGAAVMDSVPEEEYEHASGAGFYGFTRALVVPEATDVKRLFEQRKSVVIAAEGFLQQVDFLMAAMRKGNGDLLGEALTRAREGYHLIMNL